MTVKQKPIRKTTKTGLKTVKSPRKRQPPPKRQGLARASWHRELTEVWKTNDVNNPDWTKPGESLWLKPQVIVERFINTLAVGRESFGRRTHLREFNFDKFEFKVGQKTYWLALKYLNSRCFASQMYGLIYEVSEPIFAEIPQAVQDYADTASLYTSFRDYERDLFSGKIACPFKVLHQTKEGSVTERPIPLHPEMTSLGKLRQKQTFFVFPK